ncbi:hypothetical protein KP509_28G067400 [Ceratopteris richardii]|uniref:Uncharacterized protein n=1 Tax=Ceratopteris richardii TaxID=49495 RepID=A0A8T2RFK2_CERRI|nr:hypothetical protein KP509_28G067400 [Ceratopteris richardii]
MSIRYSREHNGQIAVPLGPANFSASSAQPATNAYVERVNSVGITALYGNSKVRKVYSCSHFTNSCCSSDAPETYHLRHCATRQYVQAPSNSNLNFSSNNQSMRGVLEELKSRLLGPDEDGLESTDLMDDSNTSFWRRLPDEIRPQKQVMSSANMRALASSNEFLNGVYMPSNSYTFGHLPDAMNMDPACRVRTLLLQCAHAIDENAMEMADVLIEELRKEVSVFGDPVKRLAAYMCEGLVAKMQATGFALYRRLKCMDAPAADVLSAMQKLYEICPYFKFAYMAANGAIAEAFRNEQNVHIFDFQIFHGTQWIPLIQGLAKRPGGSPRIRISTVEDPTAQGYPIGGMQLVRQRLCKLAESLNVPFELNTIHCKISELEPHMIEHREGEALAVNFTLQLHHLPDESVCLGNPRDRTLRIMKGLNPKVMTIVEQESNTNTTPFFTRFREVLDYYTSMFESIDVALPRDSKDRVNVEEQCLARDIVNVIACEGADRVERHELTGKWRVRVGMAGFQPHPLSSHVNETIRLLLQSYNDSYSLKEEEGALFLGWRNRPLVVASAWC